MMYFSLSEEDQRNDDVVYHPRLNQEFKTAVGAMLLLVPACVITTAPVIVMAIVQAAFLGALIFLAGVTYGIMNDISVSHNNLEYFLYGAMAPEYRGSGLIKCLDEPSAHAVAWGFDGTYRLARLAGVMFGAAACVSTLWGCGILSSNLFMIPVGIVLVWLVADGFARYRTARYRTTALPKCLGYVEEHHWNREWRATWHANNERVRLGYIALPILAVLMLAAVITLSALHVSVSLPLISALSVQCQMIVLAAPFVLLVSTSMIYFAMKMNRLKQDPARIQAWKQKMGVDTDESGRHDVDAIEGTTAERIEDAAEGGKSKTTTSP